jgi:molybdopterin-synthase adenylyltransferase
LRKYKIRNSVKFYLSKSGDELHIIFLNEHKELVIEVNEPALLMIELIGKGKTIEEIENEIIGQFSYVTTEDISEQIEFLLDLNVIKEIQINITHQYDTDFLNRQLNFFGDFSSPEFDEYRVQQLLSDSHVVIMGVGAIGSWISYNLVQSGIGKLTIIDGDTISKSNLNRQALYFRSDIGKSKVDVLEKRLKDINPDLIVNKLEKFIFSPEDLTDITEKVDLLINCSDSPNAYTTGMIVTKYCIPEDIPHINGIGYRGNICRLGTTTIPNQTMCWSCIYQDKYWDLSEYNELKYDNHKPSAGSVSSLTSLIASIHSWEAIKILTNLFKPSLVNRLGELDFERFTINWEEEVQENDCKICARKNMNTKEKR